jgi:EmrB/QacA subfamily drug resistance transporter
MDNDSLKRSALTIAVLAGFLTPFMISSINIALPAIGAEFHMSAVALSWIPTAYLLTAALCLVPFGRIGDLFGRKKLFTIGISLYTLAALLLALSPSAHLLILFRVLEGMGAAMIFSTSLAIVTAVFPPAERGRVLGINVAAIYSGLSLGPFIGGFLTQQFGWRSIFLTNIPVGLLVLYLLATRLKGEWTGSPGERFDIPGALFYGSSLVLVMYGLSRLPGLSGAVLMLCGAACAACFVWWEGRAQHPLLSMKLFSGNLAFSLSNLAALVNYSATFGVTFLMSLYLQYIKGMTPRQAGLILVAQPVVMAVFSPAAGRLSDTMEPRVVASLGMGFTCAGLLLFSFLHGESATGFIIAGLVLLGFGFALFSSPNTNAVMTSIDQRFYGVGSAVLGTMRLTGQMLSMGIAMVIFAFRIGSARITPSAYPEFLASVRMAFSVFSILCFGGIFASLARGKVR